MRWKTIVLTLGGFAALFMFIYYVYSAYNLPQIDFTAMVEKTGNMTPLGAFIIFMGVVFVVLGMLNLIRTKQVGGVR